MSLFGRSGDDRDAAAPLAERLRPREIGEVLGQPHLLDAGRALRRSIESGRTGSLILYGPPGVGKTTLALLVAKHSGLEFEPFSAVLSGIKEVREAMQRADERRTHTGRGTLLFVDEIHRFNKAQQDAFLPFVEKGRIVLVGATTENPSFAIVGALLSRCRVVPLHPLDAAAMRAIVAQALTDTERGLGRRNLTIADDAFAELSVAAGGDARRLLTILDAAASTAADGTTLSRAHLFEAAQHRSLRHDRSGDLHYDLLSALHKSLRNSDVQAAVYWLARFASADADPMQAARRMIAMAAEDIGLADPMALQVAVAAAHAAHQLGWPEAKLPLAEAAIYLAAAPKSAGVVRAIDAALAEVERGEQHPVPLRLRNAPTRLSRESGHGVGYRYAHDEPGGVAPIECLPDALVGRTFYEPSELGFEKRIRERMDAADALRRPDGPREGTR